MGPIEVITSVQRRRLWSPLKEAAATRSSEVNWKRQPPITKEEPRWPPRPRVPEGNCPCSSSPRSSATCPIGAILTDNGREFCGIKEKHPYELLAAMEGIDHRTTKIRSPRTNGFVERMNRTLLDECFRVAGRTTWYENIEQIQTDLDRFMEYYNLERSHQGDRLQGRTPAQALREALGIEELPPIMPPKTEEVEEEPNEAA
jgi:transposase InsO family protein